MASGCIHASELPQADPAQHFDNGNKGMLADKEMILHKTKTKRNQPPESLKCLTDSSYPTDTHNWSGVSTFRWFIAAKHIPKWLIKQLISIGLKFLPEKWWTLVALSRTPWKDLAHLVVIQKHLSKPLCFKNCVEHLWNKQFKHVPTVPDLQPPPRQRVTNRVPCAHVTSKSWGRSQNTNCLWVLRPMRVVATISQTVGKVSKHLSHKFHQYAWRRKFLVRVNKHYIHDVHCSFSWQVWNLRHPKLNLESEPNTSHHIYLYPVLEMGSHCVK